MTNPTWEEAMTEAKDALRPIFHWMTESVLEEAAKGRVRMCWPDLTEPKKP